MFAKSAFVIALGSAALVVPALTGCQASFQAGSEPAAAPTTPAPPPAPPPPPAETAAPAPAPAPTPAPAAAAPMPEKGDQVAIPGQIEFDTGSATFKAGGGSEAVIDQVKLFLDQNPRVTWLRIEGHTDNVGTEAANLVLSGERALAVKNAVIAKGISKDRLLAVAFGGSKPIGDNTKEEGRAKNRRTEFHIAGLGGSKRYMSFDPTGGGKVVGE